MARRKQTVYLRHMAAMQLILSMQDSTEDVPNVAYVAKFPVAPKVAEWSDNDGYGDQYTRFQFLHDLLPLVEPEVYSAFHQMVTTSKQVGSFVVDGDSVHDGIKFFAPMLNQWTDLAAIPMWSGGYPHGCFYLMREVVADLLTVEV